jgi:hypothetical protein
MLGQAHHFRRYAPDAIPYAVERYTNEVYSVIDRRLERGTVLGWDCWPQPTRNRRAGAAAARWALHG